MKEKTRQRKMQEDVIFLLTIRENYGTGRLVFIVWDREAETRERHLDPEDYTLPYSFFNYSITDARQSARSCWNKYKEEGRYR